MARVQVHVTPVAVYLLALALYSTLMLLSTLDPGPASLDEDRYQGQQDRYQGQQDRYQGQQEQYQGQQDRYQGQQDRYQGQQEQYQGQQDRYQGQQDRYQGQQEQYQGQKAQYQGQQEQYQGQQDRYQGQQEQYQGQQEQYQGHAGVKIRLGGSRLSQRNGGGWWLRRVDDFYNTMKRVETSCSKLLQLGGTSCKGSLDNNKYLCLDEDVVLAPGNCTVYSFGIGDDATFDDQISKYGCDVFMFDPTINKEHIINTNTKRQHFYPLGLDNRNYSRRHDVTYLHNNKTEIIVGDYLSYDAIRSRLAHYHHPVHYLKVDIDGAEWRVLPQLVEGGRLAGVRQLAIEVHTSAVITISQDRVLDLLHRYWRILQGLTRLGFLRAHYHPNIVLESLYHIPGENRSLPTCFELLYLRRGPSY